MLFKKGFVFFSFFIGAFFLGDGFELATESRPRLFINTEVLAYYHALEKSDKFLPVC